MNNRFPVRSPSYVYYGYRPHSPGNTTAVGAGLTATNISQLATFTIYTADAFGNLLTYSPGPTDMFLVQLDDFDAPFKNFIDVNITDNGDGSYTVNYRVTAAPSGNHSLNVYTVGEHISGSPFTLLIDVQTLNETDCTLLGQVRC